MLLLLLNYFVLRALWKINLYLISTLVNKSLHYYYDLFAIVLIKLLNLNMKPSYMCVILCGHFQPFTTTYV